MMTLPGFTLVETLYDSPGTAVYRAHADNDSARSLILKTPKAAFLRQEELTRYRREYDVLGRLDLPHVIRARELKMVGKRPVLVLEDVGGRSLAQQLPAAHWTLAERLEIAISITEGVAELHAARVIHKHLAPANIVFDPASCELRLIDFGIATHLTRESPAVSHPDTLEGTLAYLSPEQTGRMNRTLDYRSDFYSLGVTLYELFTGTLPFTSDDTLALIHKHLTLPPEPAHERNPELPAVLSDILARLMAKTADARYQSAEGIRHDLATLLAALRSDGKAPRFALGRQDVPSHFQLSQKLYGRTDETAQLLAAFERASRGAHELMLVAGYSGIGKSCLVHELFKPLTRQRGYFIGGKFDQFQKNIPYSALVSACRELVRQLLTENEARLGHWRSELAAALGASGQVIVDVIPEIELIIGRQEPVPALAPLETQNRFNLVFQGFLRVFYRPDHPLVIFLDDLQWADSATLALLSVLMTDRDARYLLIVGAYRDNEVGADHPLWSLRDGLIRQGANVAHVELAPMALDAITEMMADTLFCDADTARPLARLVKDKTGGNPFFAGQFLATLYEEGLIAFGGGSHGEADAAPRWRWDMARIAQANITDNVVELMVGKLRKLPAETVEVLKLAACLGNRFDLDSLAIVHARPLGPTFAALKAAVGEGLVIPTSALEMLGADAGAPLVFARYQFLHDRVQQAAYALIDGDVKQALHLRIGRLLLESVSVSALGGRLFEIVDHLNRGRDGITLRTERLRLAGLNLEAAKKAKSSAAYSAALGYLTCAFSVFDGDWGDDYALSLALSREGADLEYLNGNYERAEALIQQTWQNATAVQERVAAYSQLVTQRTMLGKNEEAVVAAGQALQLLGMGFPAEAGLQSALDAELLAIEQGLAGRSIADLIALPTMSDPTIRSAMQVLMTVHTTAYFANYYTLYCWVLARMTRLSMEYGNVPESAKGYASFGNTLAAHWGRYADGYEFGMLGAALADRYAHQGLKCKTRLILSMFLNHWTRPLAEAERFDEEGQRAGMKAGEFQFIGYILVHGRTLNRLFAGVPLAPLRSEIDTHLAFTRKVKHNLSTDYLIGVQRLIAVLADAAPDAQGLAEAGEEARYLDTCTQNRSFAALCSYHTLKAFVHYLLGDLDAACAAIEAAEPLLGYVKGTMTEPEHAHYLALILLARETTPGTLARAGVCLDRLRQWAVHGPANFTHKALLVEAELACATGRIADALEGYDQAIAAAAADGFLHYEALANERAARFWFARGKPEFARPYLQRALDGYRAWGAERKRAGLAAEFPEQGVESLSGGAPRAATAGRLGDLDLASVLKTSQAISGEIVLERLLDRVLRTVIENAGAERGSLLLGGEDRLAVVATVSAADDSARVDIDTPLADATELSVAIVRYVARTRQSVVLHDAAAEGVFAGDPYLRRARPKSVLCVPILQRGELSGVLYLEHPAVAGAFSPERVELLGLLSTQAAISIQNARLYASLANEVAEHHRVEAELRQTEAKYRDIFDHAAEGIFRTGRDGRLLMANPALARIMGYASPDALLGDYPTLIGDAFIGADLKAELLIRIARDGVIRNFEFIARRRDGSVVELLIGAHIIRDDAGEVLYYEGILQDISERKRLEAQLQHQATHDALTGLPNRNVLMDRLQQAIAAAERHDGRCAVCFIDLDRFKWINDSFGHDAGDELLSTLAERLKACVREADTVARIGGDEFVLLLESSGHGEDDEARIIDRVLLSIAQPVRLGSREVAVTCSVGYSAYPADGRTAIELLHFADIAMYHAKESGRNHLQRFDARLSGRMSEMVRLETELRQAIEREQLVLYYQPQVELIGGRIVGVEALLRWEHPELGQVEPARFIPLAEETGLIHPIGEWAIHQACQQNRAWQRAGLAPVRMAVNLSAAQLSRPGLETLVAHCLATTGLDPAYLELELTESASMSDPQKNIELMHRLKALGIGLAIDDFGTAYSNMYYLKSFPVNKLKLDGSFIREITSDARNLAIVDAIISLAHRLGLSVVAEMAESECQVVLLATRGCDQVQGNYFSAALDAAACAALLKSGRVPLPEALAARRVLS